MGVALKRKKKKKKVAKPNEHNTPTKQMVGRIWKKFLLLGFWGRRVSLPVIGEGDWVIGHQRNWMRSLPLTTPFDKLSW